MAETFLTLTNKTLVRMNEVELTASNFASPRGVQTQCQNAVNESIRYINQREFAYPFNHATNSSTLTPGVAKYTVPTSTKYIDYNTARIKKDEDLSSAGNSLTKLNYNEYISRDYAVQEDNVASTTINASSGLSAAVTTITVADTSDFDATGTLFIGGEQITYTGITGNDFTGCTRGANNTTAAAIANSTTVTQFSDKGGIPRFIVRTPDNNYILYPFPDKQYTLIFDYFTFPADLSAATDTTTIPDRFATVIIDGAVAYVYQYRGEIQQYQVNFERFQQGIKNMQTLVINKYDYIRSTLMGSATTTYNPVLRVS